MPLQIHDNDHLTAYELLKPYGVMLRDAVAKAIADERERCALVAEHLNGWGSPPAPDLAAHIAKIIRQG